MSGSADPELAAIALPASVDQEEHLNTDTVTDRARRRESVPLSFVSDYTSGTGTTNSIYEDAASAQSQATITRSETDHSAFLDAQEGLSLSPTRSTTNFSTSGSGQGDSTVHLDQIAQQQPPVAVAPAAVPPVLVSAPAVIPPTHRAGDGEPTPKVAQGEFVASSTAAAGPSAEKGASLSPKEVDLVQTRSQVDSEVFDEKRDKSSREAGADTPTTLAGRGGKKGGDGNGNGKDESVDLEDPELSHLTDEQRKIVAEQIYLEKPPPAGLFTLFRYSTKFEVTLNLIGLLAAIVAGAAQPLMTIVFGSLTTAFTSYATALSNNASADEIARSKSVLFGHVNDDALFLVYIAIAMFAATFIYTGAWVYTGEATTRRIREKYLKAVLRQNVAYFDKLGPGEVTTRIQTDTHLIQEGISDKIPMSVMFFATFITGFVVAMVKNWRLALVVATIIPCIAIAGAAMNVFISKFKTLMLEKTAEGGTLAEEVFSSVRNTHAFGTQAKLTEMYDIKNRETLEIGIRSAIANAVGMVFFFFIIYSAYALAFYYGTTLILQGRANSGQIVTVFFSILIGAFSLAQIAPNLQAVAFARGAATTLFATIDRVPVIDSASDAGQKPEKVEGNITLENVDFIYPARPSVQVLHSFTGTFPSGKMTALVGASGSGKSTIVGLVERFYDPVGGKVKLDGIDLKDLNVKWLRSHIGLVSQEPTLFATTVFGNIAHGLIGTKFEHESEEKKRERIIAAATQANADGFITALPEGYDTLIGERGMLLSGGQKQRIAIARAIVGDPAILLLDEATSALDTASEAIVQDALDRASAGRTTITIAHRLSTIKGADQIIVMSSGHILESAMSSESGTAHATLLKNPDGAYSKLVVAQRFRERRDEDEKDSDSQSGDELPVGGLTREQADEIARNEKPALALKRTGTGRSAASEALEQKRQRDLEAGQAKPHSFVYLLNRLVRMNTNSKLEYLIGVGAGILCGCVYPIFGIVFGGVIGVFSVTDRAELRHGGDRYALYCFIIAIVASIAVGLQNWAFGVSSERLSRIIRVSVFKAILRQDIAFFDREENSTGHLTSSVADWAQRIAGLMGITAGVILQSTFTLIVGSIVGLSYGWRVALVGIACFPLTIAAGFVRLRVVVLKDAKNKKAHEQSAQMACEAAGAIRTVASLTREEDCCNIYSNYLEKPQQESNRTAVISNAYYSLSQSLTFPVIALIFWYGSHLLVEGRISSRTFFIAMISVVFGSIQAGNVFSFVPDMSKARGAADDVVRLLDARPEIDAEEPVGNKFVDGHGHIVFKDVHFRYPTRPHVRVLRGLELEVKPGQFVAIVGPSGCGKSTLIQLVERFYDPLAGTVEVDGQDVSELDVQSYRQSVALVSQEPTLYAGTVKWNITLGANMPADQITQEQIEKACKDANIHDFIMSLPDQYETQVGGKGAQLSGGQKQRIAIARALIRNPKILLLDEATSALDSESEKVVQKALDQAAKGRSTIAVAHRLSTIQGADCIYVLRDGKVSEKGTHWELLALGGLYKELVDQQSLEKRT
ncbi:P-loop containing nucleoside triphosphate hydrolase protein [Meredithblackwellia eburnea MCA 4105]